MNPQLQSKISTIISTLEQNQPFILFDDVGRENEADMIYPAENISESQISFMLQHTTGIICLAMSSEHANKLAIQPMIKNNQNQYQTPFGISIEAAEDITTGVSAKDRAQTIRTAANTKANPNHIKSPGHIFPLIAQPHGIFQRRGHTEGSVDMMQLAQLSPCAAICELMHPDGSMMQGEEVLDFAKQHQIPTLSIEEIFQYRIQTESRVLNKITTQINLNNKSDFTISIFENMANQEQAVVIYKNINSNPFIRIHSACFTGDILGSSHCDCQSQLDYSLDLISRQGGMVIYLNQEGRGIGLENKLKAYELQRQGLDTVEANEKLGLPVDSRTYELAAMILHDFKIKQCRLLTNNPNKLSSLNHYGIDAKAELIKTNITEHNKNYLHTKQTKLNHLLDTMGEL